MQSTHLRFTEQSQTIVELELDSPRPDDSLPARQSMPPLLNVWGKVLKTLIWLSEAKEEFFFSSSLALFLLCFSLSSNFGPPIRRRERRWEAGRRQLSALLRFPPPARQEYFAQGRFFLSLTHRTLFPA